MNKPTRFIVRGAVIAALYAALTLALAPIAYGPVQFRASEALTILPLLWAEAIPGLAIGCFLANIPAGIWDMIIGSLATLLAAIATRAVKKIYFGVIPPVIFNALLVPVIFLLNPEITQAYWISALSVGASELVSVVALGIPLYFALARLKKSRPSLMD